MIRAFVLLIFVLATAAHAQSVPERTTGVGAHPLSDSVAATWFITSKTESTKRLAAIIFLMGAPGWTGQPTDWKWEWGDPAYSYFKVGDSEIRAWYYPAERRLSVLAHDAPVSTANVLVVRGFGQGPLRVSYSEHVRLDFAASENPSTALVYRSEALRAELSKP